MRSLSSLTIIMLAGMTLGVSAGYAQTTPPSASNCGVETWSTDKMAYVNVPCAGAPEQNNQTAKAPGTSTSNCGVETWSTDKMAYVGSPCPAGITYENPGSK